MHAHDVDPNDWQDAPYDGELDLGHSHYIRFFSEGRDGDVKKIVVDHDLWDRTGRGDEGTTSYVLEGQPTLASGQPATGGIIRHRQPRSPTGWCEGGISWWRSRDDGRPLWTLHSLEPLHVEPSVLCKATMPDGSSCDDHGFIRDGKWVVA